MNNSIACKVVDATGAEYLHTFAAPAYEPQFRKHAQWWIGYMKSPARQHDGTRQKYGAKGMPVMPCKIVVEPYHDESRSD